MLPTSCVKHKQRKRILKFASRTGITTIAMAAARTKGDTRTNETHDTSKTLVWDTDKSFENTSRGEVGRRRI